MTVSHLHTQHVFPWSYDINSAKVDPGKMKDSQSSYLFKSVINSSTAT